MTYIGFYFEETVGSGNSKIKEVFTWGITYTLAILISIYTVTKMSISDSFLYLLLTTTLISIFAEIVRAHTHEFRLNWFLFYFLVYANSVWLISEFVLPFISHVQSELSIALITGFVLSGVYNIIQKSQIREKSIKWLAIVLVFIIIVSNLSFFQSFDVDSAIKMLSTPTRVSKGASNSTNILSVQPTYEKTTQTDWKCPEINFDDLNSTMFFGTIRPENIQHALNGVINSSIWRIDNDLRACYMGKYKGQYPENMYCDDMVISRWATDDDGTIKYRWYTVVDAVLVSRDIGTTEHAYAFHSLVCTNGKRIEVDKKETQYYVYDSRDGTRINIKVEGEDSNIIVNYQ
jgi:hypothetical protein